MQIEGKCKEVLDKTEWVAIATCGDNGPHIVATWGEYVRALKTEDSEIIIIPAGYYNITEANLKINDRVELLIASKQVQGTNSLGQGCCISGKGEIQTSGKFADLARSKFPWAKGAFVITVENVSTQL
ncbi:pyridoxamine 5'-phosphate oxidase family protein [Methanomethylovorans sp.]|uniref:pyridoxamine 5'-phosphate oxidase family protein n=1 Tax=Methanomethylovorans sp. TaxID=2758717 RepID=UPI00345E9580